MFVVKNNVYMMSLVLQSIEKNLAIYFDYTILTSFNFIKQYWIQNVSVIN